MNAPAPNTTGPARRLRGRARLRRMGQLAIAAVIAVLGFLMLLMYLNYRDRQRLADAIAEADRLDPAWRLADVLASRPPIPDEQNGALRLLAAYGYRQGEWIPFNLDSYLGNLTPCECLLPERAQELREKLTAKEAALIEARKMAELPDGRFSVAWSTNPLAAGLPIEEVRSVVNLLSFDVNRRLEDGDLDGALVSCRAAVHASRYIGEEPSLLAFLVRAGCLSATLNRVERILAQGEAPESALRTMQQLLQNEERRSVFHYAARGHRAMMDHGLELFDRRVLPRGLLARLLDTPDAGNFKINNAWLDEWFESFRISQALDAIPAARGALLKYHNQFIAIAKLPAEDQTEPLAQLHKSLAEQPRLVRTFAASCQMVGDANLRTVARLRAAMTIIAVERYRMMYKRWPDRLEELTPSFLPQVPLDPFTKVALRFSTHNEGLVIYSVGPDGKDHGGDVDPNKPGTDIGFRLWDPDKRRQPAKPKAEDKNP